MEMSFSNCHPCFQLHTSLCKFRVWIENMMAMLGARWSQPILRIILGLASGKLVAWVTCGFCMTIVKTLFALDCVMKSSNVVSAHISSHGSNGIVPIYFFLCMKILSFSSSMCGGLCILDEFIMLCIDYH